MRYVWNILFKGLAAVLPVTLTLYLVDLLGISIERALYAAIVAVVPEQYYLPEMGLVAGLILLFFVGFAVNAWFVRQLFRLGERVVERIPLVKSIHRALRDFFDYFSTGQQRSDLRQVVMASVGYARLLGFLTREQVDDIPGMSFPDGMVAVYLPMSYQIGGYTLYLPRSYVNPVDMSLEDAMRRILTGGVSKSVPRTQAVKGSTGDEVLGRPGLRANDNDRKDAAARECTRTIQNCLRRCWPDPGDKVLHGQNREITAEHCRQRRPTAT